MSLVWGTALALPIGRMGTQEDLYRAIESRSVLPPQVSGEDAAVAVLCVLAQQVSGGELRHLLGHLPERMLQLIQPCLPHREEAPAQLGRDEFLRRVGDRLEIGPEAAAALCREVFRSLQEMLPAEEKRHVRAQLPRELDRLWDPPDGGVMPATEKRPAEAAPGPGASATAVPGDLLRDVERSGALPPGVKTTRAITAVLCVRSQELAEPHSARLLRALPFDLRDLVEQCRRSHPVKETPPTEAAVRAHRIAEHLSIDENRAEEVAGAVLAALRRLLPEEAVAILEQR